MHTHTAYPQANQQQAATHAEPARPKGNAGLFQFKDNRPSTGSMIHAPAIVPVIQPKLSDEGKLIAQKWWNEILIPTAKEDNELLGKYRLQIQKIEQDECDEKEGARRLLQLISNYTPDKPYKSLDFEKANLQPKEKSKVMERVEELQELLLYQVLGGRELVKNKDAVFGLDGKNEQQIIEAFKHYTRFDLAESYGNTELFVSLAQKYLKNRSGIMIIYKFNVPALDAENSYQWTLMHISSLANQVHYLDVVMLHNQLYTKPVLESILEALKKLQQQQLVKNIGLSNLAGHHSAFNQLNKKEVEAPFNSVNVIENDANLFNKDEEVHKLAQNKGLGYLGYGILNKTLLEHPEITELAKLLKMTPSQLLISYAKLQGIIPVVSSSRKEGIQENALVRPEFTKPELRQIQRAFASVKKQAIDQQVQVNLPMQSDAVKQIALLLAMVDHNGNIQKEEKEKYFETYALFKQDGNFKEFLQMSVPSHKDINAQFLNNKVQGLFDTFPNNSCDCFKKNLVLLNTARFFEATRNKPAVGSSILKVPNNDPIEIDLTEDD